MTRPPSVINIADVEREPRPRFTRVEGVAALVGNLGDAVGLEHMGVHLRTIEPGNAGTNRHFHNVEEEWAYVLSGRGRVRIGPHDLPVQAGHFVGFVPGPRPHHFIAEGDEPLVLLEGGERRLDEDSGWYPDARRIWRAGEFFDTEEEPPPETGDRQQCLHTQDGVLDEFVHDVDPQVMRSQRALHEPAGLLRQAVYHVTVAAGARTTAFHTHETTEEWIYILSGQARARSGSEYFDVGPGDFLGYPRRAPAHVLQTVSELVYLMGGQIDDGDTVTYPEAGLRRVAGRLEPI